ncbi:MAG: hypothetical protein Q9208_006687 [Pyrenodesmia sp. 3 TL-2023]
MASHTSKCGPSSGLQDSTSADVSSSPSILPALTEACAQGSTTRVRACLERWRGMASPVPRRPPSKPTLHLQPALLAAIQNNHPAVVSLLLDQGFIIGHEVVRAAIETRSFAILQAFLNHGWNINKQLGPTMAPALSHVVEDIDLVRWFLAHGANPNGRVPSWPSPLEVAARKAPLEVIETMIQHGGRAHPGNALPSAAQTSLPNRTDVLAYLLDHGTSVNVLEFEYDQEIFRLHWMREFGTALHHAAKRGNDEIVKFLLERGADKSLKDSVGKTALQYAEEKDLSTTIILLAESSASTTEG